MGGFSPFHWLIDLIILGVVFGIPVAMVLKKAGYSRWLTLLAFVPLVNMVCLWIFAFQTWPALKTRAGDTF
jgi:hypothetical protein